MGVQYTGDIMSTLGVILNTLEGYQDACGVIMSTPGGVQYTREIP